MLQLSLLLQMRPTVPHVHKHEDISGWCTQTAGSEWQANVLTCRGEHWMMSFTQVLIFSVPVHTLFQGNVKKPAFRQLKRTLILSGEAHVYSERLKVHLI